MDEVSKLLDIMAALRHPETGCPWDQQQNFDSIAAYTIEEAYEVVDAIERKDMDDLKTELGDLLFHIVYHSRLAEEQQAFAFADVVAAINEKLVRRHPHVFADVKIENEADLYQRWEAYKKQERDEKTKQVDVNSSSLLDGIAATMPALRWAENIQRRVASVGFDWRTIEPVWDKLQEEVAECREQAEVGTDAQRLEEELGDVLFSVVNLARHLSVTPEQALRRATRKFISRFKTVESILQESVGGVSQASQAQMEQAWMEAKKSRS